MLLQASCFLAFNIRPTPTSCSFCDPKLFRDVGNLEIGVSVFKFRMIQDFVGLGRQVALNLKARKVKGRHFGDPGCRRMPNQKHTLSERNTTTASISKKPHNLLPPQCPPRAFGVMKAGRFGPKRMFFLVETESTPNSKPSKAKNSGFVVEGGRACTLNPEP